MSEPITNLNDIWNETKKCLLERDYFDSVVFDTYFEDTKLYKINGDTAIVVVLTKLQKAILDQETWRIEECLKEVIGKDLSCNILIQEDLNEFRYDQNPPEPSFDIKDNILSEFTFDNFVVGKSNKECYSAALACAYNPINFLYSPLFIYGNSGLGKTHLLHSIGNYVKKNSPELRVTYMTSDQFITGVYTAAKNNCLDDFKSRLRTLDVLLIDDIQFLAGNKEKTHEILFNIFNDLHKNKKSIVLTSDHKPKEIKGLEERLVSRFSNGLIFGIDSPEFETALKILKIKLTNRSIDCSTINEDVLTYIATNYSQDVRQLEGALNRLIFYSIQYGENNEINFKLAMEAFRDDIDIGQKDELTINRIKKGINEYYGLSKNQLVSKTKTKNISDARHIAMYLCRKHLDVPYKKIGEEFGNRDHSTIMNACRKIDKKIKTDIALNLAIKDIEKLLFKD
ncbi:MAG: chromosomal replication initiator protein DnaA [Erysipelotrichaceae bacterium]|nr:chromosomal replication initiator protein DnaA [Erysipelotrichaceae bacterium]MDD3923552.1 chromosomal replication initiator protein DnaA [Erysipelotrichaceae bacterium]MDD4642774.1 chromosomal replication initiator protein DnaA [Erysipelotrichaceae bacterium]